MLLSAINFARGSVRIEIRGMFVERFLNICASNDIAFWDIERTDEETIRATIRINGFRRLKKYSKNTFYRIRIIKKTGLPFFVFRIKKRYALFAGAMVSCVLLWLLSGFIWTIEINGCGSISPARVLGGLKDMGLYAGVLSSKVDVNMIRNSLPLEIDEISWMAINIKGSHAEVTVRERQKKPDVADQDTPCDIKAARDAMIVSMQVREGITRFKAGDTVLKGDTIVEGTIPSTSGVTRYVHARADITGRTLYHLEGVFPVGAGAVERSGEVVRKRSVVFGQRRINLFINSGIPFDNYDKIIEMKSFRLSDELILPIRIQTESYYELCEYDASPDYEAAAAELRRLLLERMKIQSPKAEIKDVSYSAYYGEGAVTGRLRCECEEDISEISAMAKEN